MTRFLLVSRGTVGNCCSPFLLNNANFTSILLEVFYKLDFETLSISEWNTYNIITTEDLASRAPKTTTETTSSSGGGWVLPGGIDPKTGEVDFPTPTPEPSTTPPPSPAVEEARQQFEKGLDTSQLPEEYKKYSPPAVEREAPSGPTYVLEDAPGIEASREYAKIYGSIPPAGAPEAQKEFYQATKAEIQAAMEAGTYVSPLAVPHPYIQEKAETYGIPYRSAEMEARRAAEYVGAAIEGDKCGPFGIKPNEVQAAVAFYESRGRADMAEYLKARYLSQSPPELFLDRAEAVAYDIFDELAPYREGDSHKLGLALYDKVVTPEQLGVYYPAGAISTAESQSAVLTAVGTGGVAVPVLHKALSEGKITERQIRDVYGAAAASEVVNYEEMFPRGIGAEVEVGEKKVGGVWSWLTGPAKGFYPEGPAIPPYSTRVSGMSTQPLLLPGMEEYEAEIAKWRGAAPTPLELISYGAAMATPFIPTAAYARLGQVALKTLKWSVKPVQWGKVTVDIGGKAIQTGEVIAGRAGLIQRVGAGFVTAGKQFIVPTVTTTGIGLAGAAVYEPVSVEERARSMYTGISETDKQEVYADYMRQAEASYDSLVASGRTPELSREEYLGQVGEAFDPALRQVLLEQASKRMEYQPGLEGYVGRAGELLRQPLYSLEAAPGPSWLKRIGAGMYGLVAPLTVATELYPEKGGKAFATMIPYYGPVTVAGAMTWKQQPWYGRAATVGFTLLPGVTGALSWMRAPKIRGAELQLRKMGIGWPLKEIGIVEPYTIYGKVSGRLVPKFTGVRPVGDVAGPGVTVEGVSPISIAGLRGQLAPRFTIKSRLSRIVGGKARPEAELYPFREPMGYWSEYIVPEGPVRPMVGFFAKGQALGPYAYKQAAFSYPFEGAAPYVGGTAPQWLAKWADFGGRPGGLWGPGGIWGGPGAGWTWGGGGGGVATQARPRAGVGTLVGEVGTAAGPQAALGVPVMPTFSLGLQYTPTLAMAPAVAGISPTTIETPVFTPVGVKPSIVTPRVITPVVPAVLTPVTIPVPEVIPKVEPGFFPAYIPPITPTPPYITPPEPVTYVPPTVPEPITPLPPPPLFGAVAPTTRPIGKGMKGLLAGAQWIIPGAILYLPDPFGTGRISVRLWGKKKRKYGAKAPRAVIGGLRL